MPFAHSFVTLTRNSAIPEGLRDASCQSKSCQLPSNSAVYYKSKQIEVMKLEGYSGSLQWVNV